MVSSCYNFAYPASKQLDFKIVNVVVDMFIGIIPFIGGELTPSYLTP